MVKRKIYITPHELTVLYHAEKLSAVKIAERYGVDKAVIYRLMRQWSIPRRSLSDAQKNITPLNPILHAKGANNPRWKGGKIINGKGYIAIKVQSDHPFYCMANNENYIPEHRLIFAQFLGRPLSKKEYIHHRNGIKTDNRLENLQLVLNHLHNGKIKCPFCENTFGIR